MRSHWPPVKRVILLMCLFQNGRTKNPKIRVSSKCSGCHPVFAIDSYSSTSFSTDCAAVGTHWLVIELVESYKDIRVEITPKSEAVKKIAGISITLSNTENEFFSGGSSAFEAGSHSCGSTIGGGIETIRCKNRSAVKYVILKKSDCIVVADIAVYTGHAPGQCVGPGYDYGEHYNGYRYKTKTGVLCDPWEDPLHDGKYPDLKGPYCRNPGGKARQIWCFTHRRNSKYQWEYCEPPPKCSAAFQVKVSVRECIDRDVDPYGTRYLGHHYHGVPTCFMWETFYTFSYRPKALTGPWCRNLDGSKKPWCHKPQSTANFKTKSWDFCNIPTCEK